MRIRRLQMHIAHLKISKSQCVDIQTPVLENFWILYKRAFFSKKTSVDVTNTREWVFYTAAQTLAFNIILFQFCLPFFRTTYFSCFCMVSPNSFAAVKLIFIQVLFEKQKFRKDHWESLHQAWGSGANWLWASQTP